MEDNAGSDFTQLPALATPREVARYLKCSRQLVYRLVERGQLPAVRVSDLVRIPLRSVKAFLELNCRLKRLAVESPFARTA